MQNRTALLPAVECHVVCMCIRRRSLLLAPGSRWSCPRSAVVRDTRSRVRRSQLNSYGVSWTSVEFRWIGVVRRNDSFISSLLRSGDRDLGNVRRVDIWCRKSNPRSSLQFTSIYFSLNVCIKKTYWCVINVLPLLPSDWVDSEFVISRSELIV